MAFSLSLSSPSSSMIGTGVETLYARRRALSSSSFVNFTCFSSSLSFSSFFFLTTFTMGLAFSPSLLFSPSLGFSI